MAGQDEDRPSSRKSSANRNFPKEPQREREIVTKEQRFRPVTRVYELGKLLGNGSFGVVTEARCRETGETLAVKKVLQDPRYKNRELGIMKELHHPCVIALRDYYYTEVEAHDSQPREVYLNVVMDFIPETAHRVMKSHVRQNKAMPIILVKLYIYQLCRALGYLHALGLCHRDIKPQNLLVDTRHHVLKLCDFGSAKRFVPLESSVAYICSRFYRAPELMLGATLYTGAIDIWSIGCVLGELLLGYPLFSGETSVDQLVKIIQVLGTPTPKQMRAMNPNYTDFKFPDVKTKEWRKVFPPTTPDDALKLIDGLLKYDPAERLDPLEALAFSFFDELRDQDTRLPSGAPLPELFKFTSEEFANMSAQTRQKVIPSWWCAKGRGASFSTGAPTTACASQSLQSGASGEMVGSI